MRKRTDEKQALVPISAALPALQPAAADLDALEAALGALWDRLDSDESKRVYKSDWKSYCTWLRAEGIAPLAARAADVQRFVTNHLRDEKNLARASRSRALSVIREVYRTFVVAGFCPMNPAREVKNPPAETDLRTPWLPEEDLRRLADVFWKDASWQGRRDRTAFLSLALLGVRRAEAARLRVEDFAGNTVKLLVKRKRKPTVGVPPYLLEALAEWRAFAEIERGFLFPRSVEDARPISGKMLYDALKDVARQAGVNATPHAIRRSFVSILHLRGIPTQKVQLAVSHESISTTERYNKAALAARSAPGEALRDLVEDRREHK